MTNIILKLLILIFIFHSSLVADKGDCEKVSLQLFWKHQFEFAGYYIAKEKGFYKDSSLQVAIKEYDYNIDVVEDVRKNISTFGIGNPSLIIDQSKNNNLVMLDAMLQSSPAVLVALKSSGINKFQDFKNKRIMISNDAASTASLISMLKSNHISLDKDMNKQTHSFNIYDLIDGKTDIMTVFTSNELYELDRLGIKYNIFNPDDSNFEFYDVVLFTTQDNISKNTEVVERFKEASLKGWRYAFDNVQESVDLIFDKYNTQNKTKEALLYEAKVLKELSFKGDIKLGNIDKNQIQRIYDIYNLMGLVKNKIDLDKFIYKPTSKLNTLTQDEQIYLKKNKIVRMCNHNLYEPVEFAYDNNQKEMRGIALDTLNIIEKQLDIKFEKVHTTNWKEAQLFLKEKICDIMPASTQNSDRLKYANFTQAYLKLPLAILTNEKNGFVSGIDQIIDKKILRHQGSGLIKILQDKYPNINLVETKSIKDSFFQVSKGEADYTIATIPIISSVTSKYALENIHIAGYTNMVHKLGIAVRDDDILLLNILNKSLKSITKQQHDNIYKKWVNPVVKEKVTDHTLLLQITIISVLIILIILYWYRKLQKVNKILEETQKELEKQVSVDSMTKLFNRRYFHEISKQIISLAKRDNKETSIILFDIDNFKNINDTYGHNIGDDTIIKLANMLKKMSRQSDIVTRWGGEEFLILLPETSIEGADKIAQKIIKSVEDIKISIDDNKTISFTISGGIATMDYANDEDIDFVINRADNGLYKAKNNGKNQVCVQIIDKEEDNV